MVSSKHIPPPPAPPPESAVPKTTSLPLPPPPPAPATYRCVTFGLPLGLVQVPLAVRIWMLVGAARSVTTVPPETANAPAIVVVDVLGVPVPVVLIMLSRFMTLLVPPAAQSMACVPESMKSKSVPEAHVVCATL